MLYSKTLKNIFMAPSIAGIIAFSILVYVALTLIAIAEGTSDYDNFLFLLNCAFIGEISLRAFTYRSIINYFKSHSLDIIAVFPWDIVISLIDGHSINSNLLVIIRLFRLFRLHCFFSLWEKNLKNRIIFTIKKQIEQSIFKQCLLLLAVIILLTIIFGFLFKLIGYTCSETSLFYMAFMALLDPGTSMEVAGESLSTQVAFNSLIMLGIILFNGLTIGIVVAKVESYLSRIKEGYGDVVEKNHTLILGWNMLGQQLLKEINNYGKLEAKRKQKIVIVTEHIENLSRFLKSGDYKFLDIIKRKGIFFDSSTLKIVGATQASKIVILNENTDLGLPIPFRKSDVFKGCLAVNSVLSNLPNKPSCYYETACRANRQRISAHLGKNFLGFNSANYSALLLTSLLFNQHFYEILIELFGFSNDEFHFIKAADKQLEGATFSDILISHRDIAPVGIVYSTGQLELLPPPTYKVGKEDVLIFLAESREALLHSKRSKPWVSKSKYVIADFTASNQSYHLDQQHIAIIGVNETLPALLNELNLWNTHVDVLTTQVGQELAMDYFEDTPMKHLSMSFVTENLSTYNLEKCFGAIVLADDEHRLHSSSNTGDADTLFKLFDIKLRLGKKPVIAEVLTPSEERLFQQIDGVKYIVGTNILAKILNMSLVYPETLSLFEKLISLEGASLNVAKVAEIIGTPDPETVFFKDLYYQLYKEKESIAIGIIREGMAPLVNPLRIKQLKNSKYSQFLNQHGKLVLATDDRIVFLEKC